MKLLAEHVAEPELANLYRGLLASEARHHMLFVELACTVRHEAEVRARLAELAVHEAAVLSEPGPAARMHS
jgi:tRNA-(ms[2]io[6]A)-hydroxylase